jgi:hypothetical protein
MARPTISALNNEKRMVTPVAYMDYPLETGFLWAMPITIWED